jgi:DNA-binding beta-propeller fold protein YncE/mono/diheme cytochrome c family protein
MLRTWQVRAGGSACLTLLFAALPGSAQFYTEQQAERGKALYEKNCESCHGSALTGGEQAPPLAGGEFLSSWNGLTAGDLTERVRKTMPLNSPGTLSRAVNTDIVAYIFRFNRFPAGQKELDARVEFQNQIKIDPGAAETAKEIPNPYRTIENFLKMPEGRKWGSTSAVFVAANGHIWVAERCGANSCANKTDDPVLEFDASGKMLKSFGSGMITFPHGIFVDADNHVWVVDELGHQVIKFDAEGKVLMTLGKRGMPSAEPGMFNQPNAVIVAANGDIFVAEGHGIGTGNARVQKFSKDGTFVKQWGTRGKGQGQFEMAHCLAFDSKGRLYVGDRDNARVQVFDQEGNFLSQVTGFGRPSGIFIDKNDTLYVGDSESREKEGYGHNPGVKRGIRIGSLKDGIVTAFIPDTWPDPETASTSGAEGIAVDAEGSIYAAEVAQKGVKKYVKK